MRLASRGTLRESIRAEGLAPIMGMTALPMYEDYLLNRLYNGERYKVSSPARRGKPGDVGIWNAARRFALEGWVEAVSTKQNGRHKVVTLVITKTGRRAYERLDGRV